MKRSFHARVAELEKVQKVRVGDYAAEIAAGSARDWVRRLLKILRTEQEGNESMAEALARSYENKYEQTEGSSPGGRGRAFLLDGR